MGPDPEWVQTCGSLDKFSCGCQNHFGIDPILAGIGEFATHFRLPVLVGHWDVHWGYDVDFEPWPFVGTKEISHEVGTAGRHLPSSRIAS